MSEQQNHHCLLTFLGFDWRIVQCRSHEIVGARDVPGVPDMMVLTAINTSGVDWDAYAEAARAWDERAEAVRTEVVPRQILPMDAGGPAPLK